MQLGEFESDHQKLSHICIFRNCQKGKKNGEEYCRMHNSSSIDEDEITISKVAGNSGFTFATGFFVVLVLMLISDNSSLEITILYFFWGFVFACASIIFFLVAGVSKKIESKLEK